MNFNSLRDAYREEVIRTRRAFHAAPELSGHEWNTAERIRAILTGAGIPWEPCGKELPGTLVTIDGVGAGKTILLRADIDALPIEEKNDVPYKSGTKGVMHACGHDCHIAMLLAAAKILYEHRTVFPGRVKCIFQPAEENSRGALDMIAGGVLEGVDAAFGIHVASSVPSGKVSLRSGPSTAATDFFRITLHGRSGHAARPNECIDVAPAIAALILELQTIRSREANPLSTLVLTIGTIHSGSRWNVIPGEASIEGTVRSYDPAVRDLAETSLRRISEDVAAAYGCTADVTYDRLCDALVNDEAMTGIAREASEAVLGAGSTVINPPGTGGEDFSFYANLVPSSFAHLGVRNAACGADKPQHSDCYMVDENALVDGALIHVATALRFLTGSTGQN
ncbi:MAG: amidohydrolase [Mesosutterella multiformis]|jgi:amidohydrolase|nr:amidohydrolase [Mesosutterella multiformis]RGU80470.1 amidohydrolase [Sutterella sp. AF15-45LB]RGU81420.1 amidohydrolase [Sutterella sp. AF15-44LB]RHH07957.1 amidohydrolase [Sutterella sp. AM18-8-1]